MGSGSSKAKRLTAQETPDLSSRKPVANVNKSEPSSPRAESAITNAVNNNNVLVDKLEGDVDSPSKLSLHENKQGRVGMDRIISGYNYNDKPNPSSGSSTLQFEDDSDYNDDIDTILEIPVAVNKSKEVANKQKTIKQPRVDHSIGADQVYDINTTSEVSKYSEVPLPETYAQRLQRQQYTRQQNLLLSDKEFVKAGPEWRQDEEEEDVGTAMSQVSSQTGFDASKFRAVNRGRGFNAIDVHTSAAEDSKTQHYLHSSMEHDLDDFEVNTRQDISIIKQLPQYDQSELDLMRQLEDGIF